MAGLLLRSVQARRFKPWPDYFPYNVPVLSTLDEFTFTAPVTFLVGENGSGKSTLLEALACAVGSITVGSESVLTDKTLAPLRQLAKDLKLVWSKRTRKGFFMRAEDFFGFAKRMNQTQDEMQGFLEEVEQEYQGRSQMAKDYARMAYASELGEIRRNYGEGVDARSHGESFLNLFQSRIVPGGLYLLDEPEVPLSPKRQLSFLVMLKSSIDQGSQFIISTHSPILMSFPGAVILSCDSGQLQQVSFEDLEHFYITRDFLNHPMLYLKNLGLME